MPLCVFLDNGHGSNLRGSDIYLIWSSITSSIPFSSRQEQRHPQRVSRECHRRGNAKAP